jgi:hypothetical protein
MDVKTLDWLEMDKNRKAKSTPAHQGNFTPGSKKQKGMCPAVENSQYP